MDFDILLLAIYFQVLLNLFFLQNLNYLYIDYIRKIHINNNHYGYISNSSFSIIDNPIVKTVAKILKIPQTPALLCMKFGGLEQKNKSMLKRTDIHNECRSSRF